jgi:hypothetical protein
LLILKKQSIKSIVLSTSIFISGCIWNTYSPKEINNLCEIFYQNSSWYKNCKKASKIWDIPIPVMMAIMHQESKFVSSAKPPRTKCLFIFPGPRPSSAFGYSQAIDSTWKHYIKKTRNIGADRDDFDDAIDFIGWYCNLSKKKCKISKNDTYNLYLAYHEGQSGFLKKTYNKKPWLKKIAKKVKRQANTYSYQLSQCRHNLNKFNKCFLWPF